MIILALSMLAVALAASIWTIAYAVTDAIPNLLWLAQMRREDAAWELGVAMHATLDTLIVMDNRQQLAALQRV